MEDYTSQEAAILSRAQKEGIRRNELNNVFEHVFEQVAHEKGGRSLGFKLQIVELRVWMHFFPGEPFPGNKEATSSKTPNKCFKTPLSTAPVPVYNKQYTPCEGSARGVWVHDLYQLESPKKIDSYMPKDSKLSPYNAQLSEAVMVAMATREGLKREFFQYLQKMRDYSKLNHKGDNCRHSKGWCADNLTWQKFFGPEPFPYAQPCGRLGSKCTYCMLLPEFPPMKSGRMSQNSLGTLGPGPSAPRLPTTPQSAQNPARNSQMSRIILGHLSNKPLAPAPKRPSHFFHPQSPPPLPMTTQLAQVWARNPFLGKGTVIMQNTLVSICNKTFISEVFKCFMSDTEQRISAIGAELKCHIHYYVTSAGDLFLWTEPQILGDAVSFQRGHAFITGWVARVSSFDMVKLSVHWNAIRTPVAPLAQPPPIAPVDTADTLHRLSNDLQAATDKAGIPLSDGFENPEKQWAKYEGTFRTSDIDRLMMEEAAKSEGDLRMVLDKESGEVVSVEELVRRTVLRCGMGGPGQGAGKKRKVGDLAA